MKYAFLHGKLHDNVFVEQHYGYIQKGNEHKAYKLKEQSMDQNKHHRLCIVVYKLISSKKTFKNVKYEHT